jgi:hypothetical protein
MRSGERRGAVLLEVIVALAIVATAGSALAVEVRESLAAEEHAQAADIESQAAGNYLDIVALWPREDLDGHLGVRAQGPWLLGISRPEPVLYLVTVADSATGAELLRTVLYRPVASR